ncbi:MAG TPA: hypothetical protein VFU21_23990, partial [Kofleriaceae bacterium]|nr:hypothetical protein [Kofleriaceae bacterium]
TGHDEPVGAWGCGCGPGARLGGGGTGVGTIGTRRASRPAEPDRDALLAGALAAPLRACRALHGAGRATLTVETTVDEVVDVSAHAGGNPALAACAADAAWALALPAAFDQPHATFRVPVPDR